MFTEIEIKNSGLPFKDPLMIVTPGDVKRIVEWAVDGRGAVPREVKT